MNRRDFLLNEMNIPQWVLRKPQALKGDARIQLAESVKLLIVCEDDHQTSPLFADILRALALNSAEYQWLNAEQAKRLEYAHSPMFWLIGEHAHAGDFAKKSAKPTAWQNATWQELAQPEQKRRLWQNILTMLQQVT